MQQQIFEGVKIADFSWVVVGPLTIQYLAAYGATVVRIESKSRFDGVRVTAPFKDNKITGNTSIPYANLNRNKYGATLNLKHPEGIKVARRFVQWADIVAESMTPGVIERLGLGYEELKKIKPDIIMISMSNQGRGGPRASQPGLGLQLVSLAGFTHITGWPDREPAGPYGAYTDFITPKLAAAILAAALDYRRRTGEGQYIDISQNEASMQSLSPLILDYTTNEREANRNGNRHPQAAPHGVYRCLGEERWVAITVFSDSAWARLCDVTGHPEWTKEQRFLTLRDRKRNEDELDRLLEAWTVRHRAEDVMEILQQAGVSAGVVKNAEDLVNDPQLNERNCFFPLDHSEMGTTIGRDYPFTLSKTPGKWRQGAPCLGEHNAYVYTKLLGMPDEEFLRLLEEGVLD